MASDETMHLVRETLQAAVTSGHEVAASIEPVISPIMLSMWASHVSDPFISIDALEVLEAIKKTHGRIHPLASRVLPYIGPTLNNATTTVTRWLSCWLCGSCYNTSENAPIYVLKEEYQVSFDPVVRIVLHRNDQNEMQGCEGSSWKKNIFEKIRGCSAKADYLVKFDS
ncbi:hypothetical protein OROMI_023922 [Orobanche minor]